MAGYVTVYEGAPGHNFTYATVRGASHMVPQTKPLAALVMIDRFVHGEGFQTFNGTSIGPPH
jgi:carboxypeptidase C (cathepsin A)